MDRLDLAYHAITQFVGSDIHEKELKAILETVLDFDFPLNPINGNVASLELYHGPTMAFKDVGARFMAQCLGHFSKDENKKLRYWWPLLGTPAAQWPMDFWALMV